MNYLTMNKFNEIITVKFFSHKLYEILIHFFTQNIFNEKISQSMVDSVE